MSHKAMLNELERDIKKDKAKLVCEKCNRKFKYRANFDKHSCCLNNEMDDISKTLYQQKEILKSLLKNGGNGCNTTNILNQNNINITINDFGKEDISHITDQFVLDIISKMNSSSLIKYIQAVHYGNPCNLNIILPGQNQKFVLIWKNNQWVLKDKGVIIDGMIVKNFDRINDVYEKMENKLPKSVQNEYTNYADTFDYTGRKSIINDTEKMLVNKKQLIG